MYIQLHFLTSYAPSNLNRDDLGRPKNAIFGGAQRLRVSSQCLKRTWRSSETFAAHLPLGMRTNSIGNQALVWLTQPANAQAGILGNPFADAAAAQIIAGKIATVFDSKKKKAGAGDTEAPAETAPAEESAEDEGKEGKGGKGKAKAKTKAAKGDDKNQTSLALVTSQMVFFSAGEVAAIKTLINRVRQSQKNDISENEYDALLTNGTGSPDLALFGRMLAHAPQHNVDAAAQVAHAITVHKATLEDDFFTAMDDLQNADSSGAVHMGNVEFGAGLYYNYVCIDVKLLLQNLADNTALAQNTVRALCKAALTVSPSGKQNTFASRAYASYALVECGTEQPRSLSVAFLKPVSGEDFESSAVKALRQTKVKFDKAYGSETVSQEFYPQEEQTGTLEALCAFAAKGVA